MNTNGRQGSAWDLVALNKEEDPTCDLLLHHPSRSPALESAVVGEKAHDRELGTQSLPGLSLATCATPASRFPFHVDSFTQIF